jgi:hypothetical protein
MICPPIELNPNTEILLKLAEEVARGIGMDLHPVEEYGGVDGCFLLHSVWQRKTVCGRSPMT